MIDGSPARTAFVWLAALTSSALLVFLLPGAQAAEAAVGLGTAGTYSVLGGQAVTNTGPSTLSGDLGVSPGTAIVGFPPGTVGGATHAGDAQAAQAQSDLVTAYNDAAGRTPTATVAGDLVGQTLTAGVYKSTGPLALSGTLTLDGQGNRNAVFIFQIASTLTTASASNVKLINGAQACNVFWQVGSSATLGTTSSFKGTIMALTSITVTTGTVVDGHVLARNGQVSLDNDTFTTPDCDCTTTTTTTTGPTTTTTSDDHNDCTTTTTTAPTTTTTAPTTTTTAPTTTTTAPTSVLGTSFGSTGSGGGGGSTGSGASQVARTGVSPLLGPLFGLGALMIVVGGLLLAVGPVRARSRRSRQPQLGPRLGVAVLMIVVGGLLLAVGPVRARSRRSRQSQ